MEQHWVEQVYSGLEVADRFVVDSLESEPLAVGLIELVAEHSEPLVAAAD